MCDVRCALRAGMRWLQHREDRNTRDNKDTVRDGLWHSIAGRRLGEDGGGRGGEQLADVGAEAARLVHERGADTEGWSGRTDRVKKLRFMCCMV